MYSVSEAYKKAMKEPVQRYHVTGVVDETVFTDENILSGSFSITNQCSDESSVLIGQVYIGELKITLMNLPVGRYTLKDKKIMPYFGIRLADGKYENIPLGVFTITEANWGESGIEITAYDNMSKLDKSFSGDKLTGTPYELLNLACKSCGLLLSNELTDFLDFANGFTTLQLYADNDVSTWRDLVSWIGQVLGCNVFADREGKIKLRSYNQTVVDVIDDEHRLTGSKFGDYVTRYTGVSCVNIAAQTTSYYGAEEDTGLTYNLGSNPFLQSAGNADIDDMRRNVLASLFSIEYVPFNVSLIGNPCYDLMDVFSFTGGIADETKLFCMTKYVWKYNNSYEMEGVGKNPALVSAASKSDKNLSGLMAQVEAITNSINKLIYDYNTGPLYVGQSEQTLGVITYYISEQADVEAHFLMEYTASEPTHLIIRFYDTTVEELYSPIEMDVQEGPGVISIPHSYLLRKVGIHTVYATAEVVSGQIFVDTRGIFFTVNAGNFAKAVDDIGMDIRDITMRQLLESNGPDQIWTIGIEEGELLVSRRPYSENENYYPEWEGVYTPGKAKDGAIEFDGSWVLRAAKEKYTIETEDEPWYFWIDLEDNLIAQHGNDEKTRLTLDANVKTISACKGYSSELYPDHDQGLVAAYTKTDGTAFYRQLIYVTEKNAKDWQAAEQLLPDEAWDYIKVSRLNDYRMSFVLSNSTHNMWLITTRTYVGQSVFPENYSGFEVVRSVETYDTYIGYYSADYEFPAVSIESKEYKEETTGEGAEAKIQYVYNLVLDYEVFGNERFSSIASRITYNSSIENGDVTWEAKDGKTYITLISSTAPKSRVTEIYVNKSKNAALRVRDTDGKVVSFEQDLTATWDITRYSSKEVSEGASFVSQSDIDIEYIDIVKTDKAVTEEMSHAWENNVDIEYLDIIKTDKTVAEEYGGISEVGITIGYYQTGQEPA